MNSKNSSVMAVTIAAVMVVGGMIAILAIDDANARHRRGGDSVSIDDNNRFRTGDGGRGGDGGDGGDGGCRQGGDCEASPGSRGGEVSPGSRGGETGDNEDVGNGEIDASGGSGGDGGNGGDSGDIEIG